MVSFGMCHKAQKGRNMKKYATRAAALCLAVLTLLFSAVSCGNRQKTLLTLEKTKLSVNLFEFFMSRTKGTLSSSYYFGEAATDDDFWDGFVSMDGKTYDEFYKESVLSAAKHHLAAAHVFDELGLKLPKEKLDEIDEEIAEYIEYDADGSKSAFNAMLSAYGINVKMLREAYVMEAKTEYLSEHLYGAAGEKIADSAIEEYYGETYARFKQIFLYTYRTLYEKDADGNAIYYTENNRIAYDKSKIQKKDAENNFILDKNGDVIYVNEDGTVAYDKQNGKRATVYDANGNAMQEKYSADEMIETIDFATSIVEEKVKEGNYVLFDTLVADYSEERGKDTYPNGYYITRTSDYSSGEVVKAVFEMEEGEVRTIHSDYGIHIVMRYELDERGYANEDNEAFFISKDTGTYVFLPKLKESLFTSYLAPYVERIEVNESLYEAVSMKKIDPNFDY